jgi:hypothetical protein
MATKNKIIKTSVPRSSRIIAESLRRANIKARIQRSDAGKKRK